MSEARYPKRLIEVDLPIKRISEHARREKSIRHGHISTLHIWWARRPLAACRAVLCSALWPDPADPLCPAPFRSAAVRIIGDFARKVVSDRALAESCAPDTWGRWQTIARGDTPIDPRDPRHMNILRYLLLDFAADFANWDNATRPEYLRVARALTRAAHEALAGPHGSPPLVVDPFAGGGAVPLEALRVGAEAFASDLNPVAVLLEKVLLEYAPRYGQHLAEEVSKWGAWVQEQATAELAHFYPADPDGGTPIAYLWARTIFCEGPGCGAEVPIIRSTILGKRRGRVTYLELIPDRRAHSVDIRIKQGRAATAGPQGTVARGSVTCPVCGYTTPVQSVRTQLEAKHGGSDDARLLAVVVEGPRGKGRSYRLPTAHDLAAIADAKSECTRRAASGNSTYVSAPTETLPLMSGVFNVPLYGHHTWASLFTSRQTLSLTTLARLVRDLPGSLPTHDLKVPPDVLQRLLALAVDRQADYASSICTWVQSGEFIGHTFAQGQSLPIKFDFAEVAPFASGSGNWAGAIEWISRVCAHCAASNYAAGTTAMGSATRQPLPDGAADLVFTDPPYYNAVPYADLSDFFYVWLKRMLGAGGDALFAGELTPKEDEICEMAGWDAVRYPHKDRAYFEEQMKAAMAEACRVTAADGLGVVVFAHKETAGWEAQLQAMIAAGWTVTGSWPIDTEMAARLRARNSATLASSIHIVCRPRRRHVTGDWRDTLDELSARMHAWMPRLADEGVVGADAIFACLGPALEVFSRYDHVEKASGERVSLSEYLEYVWAAVAREALSLVFAGADTSGFEEDARLTAMWLWTLSSGDSTTAIGSVGSASHDDTEQGEGSTRARTSTAYTLEYDAARKIAQGLGAHLDRLAGLVQVKGEQARLLPVIERSRLLLGKAADSPSSGHTKAPAQLNLFAESQAKVGPSSSAGLAAPGQTVLDRVHQSMLLFAAGRGEALNAFLADVAGDARFSRLAQALSALYPAHSDEKRWVDGMLARKKALGL